MPDKTPHVKAIEEDIRFTKYRVSFTQALLVALEIRLAKLEHDREQAVQKAA